MTRHLNSRRSSARRWVPTAVASFGLILGACAGGDDAVSKSEFASRVNRLCEAEHKQVDAIFADFPDEPTTEQMQGVVKAFVPIMEKYRADVKTIGRPSVDEDRYDEYFDRLDEMASRYRAASVDAAKAEALFNEDDDTLSKLEKELGLDVCASR